MMYSPPNPAEYRSQVYEIVRQIPPGRVTTYGFIARMIPPPAGVDPMQYERLSPRWVGGAMADAPDDVPWQRVINSQGGISIRSNSDGHILQRRLLEAEEVTFDERGRTDLKEFGWEGPTAEWCRRHGFIAPPGASPQLSLF